MMKKKRTLYTLFHKTLRVCLMLVPLLFSTACCPNLWYWIYTHETISEHEPAEYPDGSIKMREEDIRKFRTDQSTDDTLENQGRLIHRAEDLYDYIVQEEGHFDFTREDKAGYCFYDMSKLYDETFFADHDLILIQLSSSSSSVQFSVRAVEYDARQDKLQVMLDRSIPKMGLTVRAAWHILIPVEKLSATADVDLVFHDTEMGA